MKYPLAGSKTCRQISDAAASLRPRVIYYFSLAVGIQISVLRQQQPRGQAAAASAPVSGLIKLRHIAGVWTIFVLLNLWNPRVISTMPQRVEFFFSLFGF